MNVRGAAGILALAVAAVAAGCVSVEESEGGIRADGVTVLVRAEEAELFRLPTTPEECDVLLAKAGGCAATDPAVAAEVARTTRAVMAQGCPKAAAARMLWTGALLRAAAKAGDPYRTAYFLDQLRWCGREDQAARVRAIGEAAADAGVKALAERVADEIARPFGVTSDGAPAHLWTLEGKGGLRLVVSDFGGRLVQCWVPDAKGRLADVTLGWNTVAEYERWGCSMGTLIGRFGNRIRDGRFTLDGEEFQLALNETNPPPRHCNLHSGPAGWDSKVWRARRFDDGDDRCIEFSLFSPHGDMGFPGNVEAKVTYRVTPANVWRLEYEATTDRPTVINLTHHGYWNLAGESSGDMLGQRLKIFGDRYTRTDAGLIPVADAPVAGTGFDFRELRPIGAKAALLKADPETAPMDCWYDHNFVLRAGVTTNLHQAVEMDDPASGRRMEIWTTEPCLQVYSSQNFDGTMPTKAKGGRLCQFAGLVLETQHYPDSPNHPEFPSTVLRPGETYRTVTEYRFGVR